jgi:hypothetical protein
MVILICYLKEKIYRSSKYNKITTTTTNIRKKSDQNKNTRKINPS